MSNSQNNTAVNGGVSNQVNVPIEDTNQPLINSGTSTLYASSNRSRKLSQTLTLSTAIYTSDIQGVKELIDNKIDVNSVKSVDCPTPLQVAASKGNVAILKLLISNSAELNSTNGVNRETPLLISVKKQHHECAEEILKSIPINKIYESISIKDKNGNTPLHLAVLNKDFYMVSMLFEYCPKERLKEYIDIKNNSEAGNKKNQGDTSLHFAAKTGNCELFNILLQNGANLKCINHSRSSVLHIAAQFGFYEMCEKIIVMANEIEFDIINCTNKENRTALQIAAKHGHVKCCHVLKNSNINCSDKFGDTALHLATSANFRETVKYLLENGSDPYLRNNEGNTSFHKAAVAKDERMLQTLIDYIKENSQDIKSPGVNKKGETVLHLAVKKENKAKVELIIESNLFDDEINSLCGKKTKFPLNSPFHLSIIYGNHHAFDILADNGADLTLQNGSGNLPLHLAAFNGNRSMIKFLLKGDLFKTINEKNLERGFTPLHCAIYSKTAVSCLSYLVTKQADVNQKDNKGYTPLMKAAQKGKNDALKFLIKCSPRFDTALEFNGNTAFHLAAERGHLSCCELLNRSVQKMVNKKNKNGLTPLDLAFHSKQDKTFCFLFNNFRAIQNKDPYDPIVTDEFQKNVHDYMHTAIKMKRRDVQKSIIGSSWWFSAFNSNLCENDVCENFRYLIKHDPGLVSEILDNCVMENSEGNTVYNFRLFEDIYFTYHSKGGLNPFSVKPIIKKYPFNETNGKLDVQKAKEFKNYKWARDHPLLLAIQHERSNILEHTVVNKYLNRMWNRAKIIFFCLLFFEVASVISTAYSLISSKNLFQMIPENSRVNEESINRCNFKVPDRLFIEINFWAFAVLICLMFHVIFELNTVLKFTVYYVRPSSIMRSLRVIGLLVYSLPVTGCSFSSTMLGLKEVWQWQIGILTFILSWFIMVNFLNELPFMNLFMPISRKFIGSFARVLTYIILIVYVFSIIFYILISHQEPFSSPFRSFMKTAVWILGDLAYDDTFVSNSIPYPFLTNFIFLMFVTFVSGFIVNLIISQPSDHLEVFKDKAKILKITSKVLLIIQLGAQFRTIRRHYCYGFLVSKPYHRKESYMSIVSPFLKWDSNTEFVGEKELSLKEEFSEMKTALMRQNKQLLDLQEQMKSLCKTINNMSQNQ